MRPVRKPLSTDLMYAGWLHNRPQVLDGSERTGLAELECGVEVLYDPHTDRAYTVVDDDARRTLVSANETLNQYDPEEL